MKLATILINRAPVVIAKQGDETPRLLDLSTDMLDVIRASRADLEASYKRGQELATPEDKIQFQHPIARPSKMIAIGLNYRDHASEQNVTPPTKPLIFAKYPSALLPPGGLIEWDPTIATQVDYEAELAVVIGKETRLVSVENALSCVFGYTAANDVTARDMQKGDGQWTRAKGLDTFCPMGPWLVTADEIPDPQTLAVRCEVDGELRQNSNTSDMIFDVKSIISHVSTAFTLFPGDIILTGTPSGVGNWFNPPRLLHDGSRVVVEVEKIGRLENLCRELTFRLR